MAAIGDIVGGYRLLARVSTARGLELWEAVSTGDAAPVWLRMADPGDAGAMRRMQREAAWLARVEDPRFPPMLEWMPELGAVAFARPEGVPLSYCIRGQELGLVPLGPATALDIALEIAHGLRQAHSILLDNGGRVVHGWLRPDQVRIAADGSILITGLGADLQDLDARRLAPEVLAGQAPEVATDQWAVAALLLEMLEGKVAGALGPGALQQALGELSRRLPATAEVLAQALAPVPEARFRPERDFIRALHSLKPELGTDSERRSIHAHAQASITELMDPTDLPEFGLAPELPVQVPAASPLPPLREDEPTEREVSEEVEPEAPAAPPAPAPAPVAAPESTWMGEWTTQLVALLFLVTVLWFLMEHVF